MKIVNFKKKKKIIKKRASGIILNGIISKEKLKNRYMIDKKFNIIFIIQENIRFRT